MIKGITVTPILANAGAETDLADLLTALGFESARDTPLPDGRAFIVPHARLELAGLQMRDGLHRGSSAPDGNRIRIEVTGLEDVHILTEAWMSENSSGKSITSIMDDDPETRFFTAEPIPGVSITFWEWSHPLKGKPVALAGDLSAEGMRFAIVVARWNSVITDRLLQGALDALYRSGAKEGDVEIFRVPGAWEIPSAARKMAELARFDAIVTLGALLRGETAHYEAIYQEVARGIGQSQQETGIPHAFGVLTCDTLEQSLDRAGLKSGNKGFEAACAAIEMASLHRKAATLLERG